MTTDFMEVQSVMIRRVGAADDPGAEVVVSIQNTHGEWRDIGSEQINSCFSHAWNLPAAWREGDNQR